MSASSRQKQKQSGQQRTKVNPAEDDGAYAAAEAVARRSRSKLIAYLAAQSRDVAAAEDALQAAFEAALVTWPRQGCPRILKHGC